MKVMIDGVEYVPKTESSKNLHNGYYTLADWFEMHKGTKEYDGIVKTIQEWYYGTLIKASWCATSVSYALSRLGMMKQTIGRKCENVYVMYTQLINTKSAKQIDFKNGESIKRGDILIYNWDTGELRADGRKHVSIAYEDCTYKAGNTCNSIGGNQDDMIKVSAYPFNNLYAVFRPKY